MRHNKRKHKLGVSGPHRSAMMGNLMTALITHGRIETTISKARALRPVIEKIITLAKKAEKANDAARKLHYWSSPFRDDGQSDDCPDYTRPHRNNHLQGTCFTPSY